MGLCASTALYLMYVAKMNDLEFQVFNINASRTTLSQKANQLGDEAANMDVPVPPSLTSYVDTSYTFRIGTDTVTIDNIRPNNEYYDVDIRQNRVGRYMDEVAPTRVKNDNGSYMVGDTQLRLFSDFDPSIPSEDKYIEAIRNTFPEFAESTPDEIKSEFYIYTEVSSSSRANYYFLRRSDIESRIPIDGTFADLPTYQFIANGTYEEIDTKQQCQLEFDTSGRITQISVPTFDSHGGILRWNTYAVSASSTTNQLAYEDAYNQYEYEKSLYEAKQNELDSKIAKIQQEDKNLEVQLTRLGNERDALKTELDSIKTAIKDNTDRTFKLWG